MQLHFEWHFIMTLKEACEEYYNIVYQRCLYELYFNEDLAAEVTQQVFVVLCEKWSSLHHRNIKSWLLRTAKYKVLKAKEGYTKAKDIQSIDADDFAEPVKNSDFYEQIISERLEKNISLYKRKVYSRLTEKEITLAEYICAKKKYSEIAELMNTTEGAVSMAAVRLFRKVKQIVSEVVTEIF